MDIRKLNSIFALTQSLQLVLLAVQGLLMIVNKSNEFYLPLWIALAFSSLVQVLTIFMYPKKIETTQLMERPAMLRLRLVALVPYMLILVALLI